MVPAVWRQPTAARVGLPVILPTVPAGGAGRAAEHSILLSTALLLSSTSLKSQWGLVKLGSPCSD